MGIIHFEFVEQGRTVNQHCYLEISARLCETVHCRRPKLWSDAWILQHDHGVLGVWEFLGENIDAEVGPSAVFARFSPVRLSAINRTEVCLVGPQIFRHCRHPESCDVHLEEHSRRGFLMGEFWELNVTSYVPHM